MQVSLVDNVRSLFRQDIIILEKTKGIRVCDKRRACTIERWPTLEGMVAACTFNRQHQQNADEKRTATSEDDPFKIRILSESHTCARFLKPTKLAKDDTYCLKILENSFPIHPPLRIVRNPKSTLTKKELKVSKTEIVIWNFTQSKNLINRTRGQEIQWYKVLLADLRKRMHI